MLDCAVNNLQCVNIANGIEFRLFCLWNLIEFAKFIGNLNIMSYRNNHSTKIKLTIDNKDEFEEFHEENWTKPTDMQQANVWEGPAEENDEADFKLAAHLKINDMNENNSQQT